MATPKPKPKPNRVLGGPAYGGYDSTITSEANALLGQINGQPAAHPNGHESGGRTQLDSRAPTADAYQQHGAGRKVGPVGPMGPQGAPK